MSFLQNLKNKLEKIPTIAKEQFTESKEAVEDFFEPSATVRDDGSGIADPDLRIRDFLRELPGATGDVAKEIAQGTARSLDFVGRTLLPGDELKEPPTSVEAKVEDFFFGGRDKRAKSLTDVGEIELGLDREKNPILTPLAGAGIIGLDLVPGGQGKSKGFKQFIKSLTDDTAETLAKSTDAELIEQTVRESAPKMTDKEVTEITRELVNTKTADEVRGVAQVGNLDNYNFGRALGTAQESQKNAGRVQKTDSIEDLVVFRDTKGQYRAVRNRTASRKRSTRHRSVIRVLRQLSR